MPNQHTKAAAAKAAKAAENSTGNILDEAAERVDNLGASTANLSLIFGGLAVSAVSLAFSISKLQKLIKGE